MVWNVFSPASVWERTQRLVPLVNAASSLLWQNFTSTLNQTVYNLTNFYYTPNSGTLLVYINGVLQVYGIDYAETDPHTVTLAEAPIEGDVVSILGFVGASGTAGQIPPATTTTIGGIIVGSTLTISPTGVLNSNVSGGTVTHATTALSLYSVMIGNGAADAAVVSIAGAAEGDVLTYHSGAAPTWDPVSAADTVLRADLLNAVGTTATGRGADIIGYVGRYTGAVRRSLQHRIQDNISVCDYPDMATVASALIGTITGTVKVPINFPDGIPGSIPLTYPVEYRGLQFEVDVGGEPNNMFSYSTVENFNAAKSFKYQPEQAHAGFGKSAVHIQTRPIGTGANGPLNADYALTVSNVKKAYNTTVVGGECNGIYTVVRNGGGVTSDGACYLGDIAVVDNSGYSAILEGTATNLSSVGATLSAISVQSAVNDARDSSYIGHFAACIAGDLSAKANATAFFANSSGTGRWKDWLWFVNHLGATTARITYAGDLSCNNFGQAATAYVPTITSEIGAFTDATINSAFYTKIGKLCFVDIRYTITTVGTADGRLYLSLPFTASANLMITGSGHAQGGIMTRPEIVTGAFLQANFLKYDGTTVCTITGVSGHASFIYEMA